MFEIRDDGTKNHGRPAHRPGWPGILLALALSVPGFSISVSAEPRVAGIYGGSDHPAIRTVFLIDNSLSIKSANREKMKELARQIIENHAEREEFILYTFSTGLQLAAAGTDYAALSSAARQIQFHDQDAYLVDCLADVLEQLGQSEDMTFNRIILMSDGVDDNKGGRTYVDLMNMLQEDRFRCPIYTVVSVWEKNTSGLKNLQALSREVGADTFVLDETEDLSRITAAIAGDYEAEWFQIEPEMMREEDTEEPVKESTEAFTEYPAQKLSEEVPGSPAPAAGFASMYKKAIIGGIVLLMFMAVLAAVMRMALSKKQGGGGRRPANRNASGPDSSGRTVTDKSLLKGAGPFPGKTGSLGYELTQDEYDDPAAGAQTVGMWDTFAITGTGKKISLDDIRDTQKRYEAILRDEITVGRDTLCTVVIRGDRTVSGTHCRLFMTKADVMVEDLHSYNGTFVNGKAVIQPEVLHDGDELKLGAARLKVSIR